MQKPQPSRFPIHGEFADCIPDQYRRAIESLLSGHRQAEVARHAGVCERTIRNWLRDPIFVQALDLARADYWVEVENRLHNAGHQAVDTLLRNLQSERPHAQIAAARLLLQLGGRVVAESQLRSVEIEEEFLRVEARRAQAASAPQPRTGEAAPVAPPLQTEVGSPTVKEGPPDSARPPDGNSDPATTPIDASKTGNYRQNPATPFAAPVVAVLLAAAPILLLLVWTTSQRLSSRTGPALNHAG